jgi:Uma2 family endonuclease
MDLRTSSQTYTYSDYLQFTFDEMVELIRGKIVKMDPAPSSTHQRIVRRLTRQIDHQLHGQRCELFIAPFDVILPSADGDYGSSDRVVQPDLCVICNPAKIEERGCFGTPDWIIEILSPSTASKDLKDKYEIYEEAGVLEYWIVDPVHRSIEVFTLVDATYQRVSTYVDGDQLHPVLFPDLTVELGEVFEG